MTEKNRGHIQIKGSRAVIEKMEKCAEEIRALGVQVKLTTEQTDGCRHAVESIQKDRT